MGLVASRNPIGSPVQHGSTPWNRLPRWIGCSGPMAKRYRSRRIPTRRACSRSMTGPCSTLHGRKQERGRTRPHQELWMLCWRSLQTARTVQLEGSLKRAPTAARVGDGPRSEEHTSELQSRGHLVCRLLLEKKKEQWISTLFLHIGPITYKDLM